MATNAFVQNVLCLPNNNNPFLQWILEQFCFARTEPLTEVVFPHLDGNIMIINVYNSIQFTLEYEKDLGEGTFGAVKLYHDKNNKVSLAVKFAKNNKEATIADALNQSNCRAVRMKQIQLPPTMDVFGDYNAVFLMELADKSYSNILTMIRQYQVHPDEFVIKRLLFDLEQIRQQMICLYTQVNSRYIYMDLKPDNVLYKCEYPKQPNRYTVFLGDLGSAVPDIKPQGLYYTATYLPYELVVSGPRLVSFDVTIKEVEGYLAWELGVLLLRLAYELDRNLPRASFVVPKKEVFEFIQNVLNWKNSNNMFIVDMQDLTNKMHIYISTILSLPLENSKYFALRLEERTSIHIPLTTLEPSMPRKATKQIREFQKQLKAFTDKLGYTPHELNVTEPQKRPSQIENFFNVPVGATTRAKTYKRFLKAQETKPTAAASAAAAAAATVELPIQDPYLQTAFKQPLRGREDAVAFLPEQCLTCGKTFATKGLLNKHIAVQHAGESYQLPTFLRQRSSEDDDSMLPQLKRYRK